MNTVIHCLIIEDEPHTADYLASQLLLVNERLKIIAKLDTVEASVEWLKSNEADLIFMDIQLGDGLSFEIFDHIKVTTPIVFTTSYDQYAIQAFEQNSISYLLKPVKKQDITKALSKYAELYGRKELLHDKVLTLHTGYQNKFMVEFGNTLRTFMSSDVAYFMLRNKRYLFIKTKDNNQFMYDSSLELLEKRVDPSRFFRINRQYIINKEIVKEVQYLSRGRLLLDTDPQSKEELVVSIGRAKTFKQWFAM